MSTATIAIPYGRAAVRFAFDPRALDVLLPADEAGLAVGPADLGFALDDPVESPPLEEIVDPGERVLIAVPRRAAGVDRVVALLLLRLGGLGVPDASVSVLVGSGTGGSEPGADPVSGDEARALVGSVVADRVAIFAHDPADPGVSLGETTRGTEAAIDARLLDADHVILVGPVGFDRYAGFAGGRAVIAPGCASPATAAGLRRLAGAKGVGPGRLDGNPVHEEMEEIARMLDPSFAVHVAATADGEISRVHAGHWRHAHRRACAEYVGSHAVRVDARRPVAVVGCGGGDDRTLVRAARAAANVAGAVEEGGAIVLVAECGDGVGGGSGAREAAWGAGDARGALDGLAGRFRVLLVSSLDADEARGAGAEPYPSVGEALAAVEAESGFVVPHAADTLPYVGPAPANEDE